ncbi:MAG: hypothetical protein JWN57_2996 [Frankiales bacterium]|jgi:hypothetical protein|nr:hypothetical protein [Frankiales bacterium]
MATILTVRERLKRQISALELVREKAATLNDLSCSAAVQAAGELGARALNVPVRVIREEHDDVVIVGLSVKAGGYQKHTIFVPPTPMTNDQYADYVEFRDVLGPAEAAAAVLQG